MIHFLSIAGLLLWIYLMFWTSYDLIISIASVFFKSSKRVPTTSTREFQIVIPAYKEGEVLVTTVQKALKVDYPKELFKVTVLAQDLDDTILKTLRLMPVDLVETGGLGSKLNALKNWMKELGFTENQFIFVLDADNLIEPNALQIADANLSHYDVIQLERIKTPPQSPLGFLDRWNTSVGLALSNDSRMVLGLNTFLLGSGFAIHAPLYQEFVLTAEPTIAEDKALDLFLAAHHKTTGFTKSSGVHDSTVERQHVFNEQRARWVGGKIEARKSSRALLRRYPGRLEFWDKAIHYSAPQRSILIPLVLIGGIYNSLLGFTGILLILNWFPLLFSAVVIFNTTPRSFYSKDLLKAVIAIPGSVFGIVKARMSAKETATQDFKVTPK